MNFQIPDYPDLQFGSVYCIGRNYAQHIAEMNSERPDNPVVFLKPRSSILFNGGLITIPARSTDVHHEVEMVLLIGKKARQLSPSEAPAVIRAYGIGLDITARDIQAASKIKGLPWTLAKGFDTFAPLGNLVEFTGRENLQNMTVEVQVNDEIRQSGNTSDMIFPVNEIVSYLSHNFTLHPGDLIFTGTPEGVSAIKNGDRIKAVLHNGISTLQVDVSS